MSSGDVSLYSTQEVRDLLSGAKFITEDCQDDEHKSTSEEEIEEVRANTSSAVVGSSAVLSCRLCNIEFTSRDDQVLHYKHDWHRLNLHYSSQSKPTLTEEQFYTVADDVSSISGSESSESDSNSDDDDDNNLGSKVDKMINKMQVTQIDEIKTETKTSMSRRPKVYMKNRCGLIFSLYRCLLHGKKHVPSSEEELLSLVKKLPQHLYWTIIMLGGGHFAAAVYKGSEVLEHKTFHSYTVRKQQGGSQSARDNKSSTSHPKSAGASLRRYNEASYAQHVHDLLTLWSSHLASCDLILIRAPSGNRRVLFSSKASLLSSSDPRVRNLPIPTRRPTYKEIQRVHSIMSTLTVYQEDVNPLTPSPKKSYTSKHVGSRIDRGRSRSPTVRHLPGNTEGLAGDDRDAHGVSPQLIDVNVITSPDYMLTKKKKKKLKNSEVYIEEVPINTDVEVTLGRGSTLLDKVYTACKMGDLLTLKFLLEAETQNQINNRTEDLADKVEESFQDTGGVVEDAREDSNMWSSLNADVVNDEAVTADDVTAGDGVCVGDHMELLNTELSGGTLLHIAAKGGHKQVIRYLLHHGSDPSIADAGGILPYLCTTNKEVRNEFRRFMASQPNKYDYIKAKIPGPLSEETEILRAQRVNDKKKERQKNKKQKQKQVAREEKERLVKEEEERKVQREEGEKRDRFLKLSDREKRALAAEERFNKQLKSQGLQCVLSRCFNCAQDITGKVPFEYKNNVFCTTTCLHTHRQTNS